MSLWCITKSEFNILNRLYCEVDVARRKLGIGIQCFHIVWNRYELWCLSNMMDAAYGTGYAYLPTYIPVITLGFMRVPTVQALVFSSVLWFFYVSSVLMLYKCNKCACLVRVSVRWVCSFLYGCPPPLLCFSRPIQVKYACFCSKYAWNICSCMLHIKYFQLKKYIARVEKCQDEGKIYKTLFICYFVITQYICFKIAVTCALITFLFLYNVKYSVEKAYCFDKFVGIFLWI